MMNGNIEKTRLFGFRIVRLSPLLALLLGVVVLVGHFYIGFKIPFIVAMFVLGMISSHLPVMQYRTGNPLYARVFGGVLGACVFIISAITHSYELSIFMSALGGLYAGLCILFGISVVFAVLKKRLIHYIETGKW